MSTNDNYPYGSIPTDSSLRRHYISAFLSIYEEENGDPPAESVLARHYQTTLVCCMLEHADVSAEELVSDTPSPAESSPPPVISESTPEPEATPEPESIPKPEATHEPEATQKSGGFLGWLRGLFGG